MASKEDYARWIVENQDRKGTPEFETVARAYRAAWAPAGMSPEAARAKVAEMDEQWRAGIDPTKGMSTFDKMAAGAGKAITDLGRGAGQMLGLVDEQDIAESRKRDAPLMDTKAGIAGNIAGNVAAFVPAAFVPGANTYTGAALAGSIFGALQPTGEDESRLGNTALGGAMGVAGQAGGNALARALQTRAQALQSAGRANQPADTLLKESVESGYTVPPSYARGGIIPRILEGVSGKYKTNQLAGIRNQSVTNQLARRALGLPEDVPISGDVLKSLRSEAFEQGYTPIRNAGRVQADTQYLQALDEAVRPLREAAEDFPDLVDDQLLKAVEAVRMDSFDTRSALSAIRILREKATKLFRDGEDGAGHAARDAAGALEDQIERHLTSMGDDGVQMLQNFRDARQLIAKTHSVEDALVSSSGNVDATALARQLTRGKPLSGELRDIGRFGESFRDVARVPKSGDANPFTVLDAFTGGAGATAAGMGGNPLLLALPLARVAARQGILSGPAQRSMARRSYDPSVLAKALQSRPGSQAVRSIPAAAGVPALAELLAN